MAYKIKIGFAREHKRSATAFTNEMLDPKTGELVAMPSMTKQSFVEQCDINNILKQFKVSGMLQHVSSKAQMGEYRDLPDEMDFQESMNVVIQAEKAFSSLPSKLRNRFGNDPAQFLEFMADPENADEIVKLGLATKAVDQAPPSAPPQAPPGSKSGPEADQVPPDPKPSA